jgi:uncharacterized protein YukE
MLHRSKIVKGCTEQRGNMERIRVDTEKLKEKSKVFESSAGVYARAGKEILAFAAGLPSCDGQLSNPARAAALEINRQCQDINVCYSNDAELLGKTAKVFEEVDRQIMEACHANPAVLSVKMPYSEALFAPVSRTHGGNQLFGFKYLSNNIVVIWHQGRTITIDLNAISPEDWQKTMDFIGKVEAFDSILEGLPSELKEIIQGAFFSLVGILTAGVLFETILGAIAGGVLLGKGIYDMGISAIELYEKCQKLVDTYNDSEDEFNQLYGSQNTGIDVNP